MRVVSSKEPAARTLVTPDGLTLAWLEKGEGQPVVLLHALMANAELNWAMTGVIDSLAEAGFRAVALDLRGHGRSHSPSDPAAYSMEDLISDVEWLIESLGLGPCHLVGYSLGALVAAQLAASGSVALERIVLAGISTKDVSLLPQMPEIDAIEALLAGGSPSVANAELEAFRQTLEDRGASPQAVVAIYRALQVTNSVDLGAIRAPVMVLNGEEDAPPKEIADRIPGALTATVGGTHVTAPFDPAFSKLISQFLQGHPVGTPR